MTTKNIIDELTFEFDLDSEGDENRGWQIDKIGAYYKGTGVAYLKLAYIPKQRYVDYYPSVFNWIDQMGGSCIIPRPPLHAADDDTSYNAFRDAAKRHYDTFTTDELRQFANRVHMSLRCSDISRSIADHDHDALYALVKELEVRANEHHRIAFRKFKTYYVDKPIDDFIRVEPEFQRQGIAEHLYKLGAKWLDSRGLPFYLSTCRQPKAEALSDKLRNNGHLRKMSNKREKFLPDTFDV